MNLFRNRQVEIDRDGDELIIVAFDHKLANKVNQKLNYYPIRIKAGEEPLFRLNLKENSLPLAQVLGEGIASILESKTAL